ncbi:MULTISPECIES: cell cycle histidine kinase CckA [Methylobacterium]|uniref:histidine kinase n=4 Tax=Pseudomonadota TaxID=1224 RepID=A0ABQ4SSU9_9HYPH|nr:MULTISPECIES: PAS domain-containing sensor histidine kinase [Methylobacterium]PIU07151.1 MAG: hybrid sensor histidine kinase/response regulator [Methylobacterium sp. CG09_land_8_20_14_0_10_71_15]PIU15642.1 MAG: hybrid sensor histidine kinase/response regulator [Methylobacterium sp. CG08_land_8_20_14_0_20_71_15]GBU18930.1 signal transduction histidine kinase [Methylobacterium sp.]GJE06285.1 Sensor kinase CckA [Methylobacterium jeotgali]
MADLMGQAGPVSGSIDRSERPGRVGLLLILAGLLVGAAVGLSFVASEQAQTIIVWLLALLAMAGVFFLFALAIGAIQLSGQGARDDITKAIVDAAPEAAVVMEEGGRLIYANEAYLGIAGGDTFTNLRPVERIFVGSPEVSEAIYRLAQGARDGRSHTEEVRMSPPPGGRPERDFAWYRISVRPLARPRRPATLWTVDDITHERERQENVFQELQHAIDYLDHAPAGFLSIDPDGSIVYMNATLASWLGYDLATVGPGGPPLAEIAPGVEHIVSAAGSPGEVRTDRYDLDLRRRNGHSLPVRFYHRVAFGNDGRPGPSRTFVINRSAGADFDEPQRAAEVRLARFLNSSPIAIATLDGAGRIARANVSFGRLFGTMPRQAIDGAAPEMSPVPVMGEAVVERDRPALEAALARAAGGIGETQPLEVYLEGPGNRTARVWLSPAGGEGPAAGGGEGDGERIILYALDTTAQRQLEQQIAQTQKMDTVGQLAGGIAHDFNNVLQAIIGYSDLLLAGRKASDPAFQDIMQIKQNANRAAGLVRQLLAFSRRQTLRPEVMNVGEALSELTLLLKRLLGERVDLELKHGREVWPVKADVNQFEQVIVNLAVNARDAMPGGGRLLIRTVNVPDAGPDAGPETRDGAPKGDHVLIEVRDTGEGIPPEIMEKIFEPFFTTKEIGKGTGLGLSTVFGIVKQSGGTVDVRSQVGEGTAFRIYLPRHVPTAEELEAEAPRETVPGLPPAGTEALTAAPAKRRPAADHTGQGTILLVEDEDPVRAVNSRALSARGYTVLEAASGIEALRIVSEGEHTIDLVVSDVVMPEMDGPTLLREIRKHQPTLKVIFVSGYAEDAFRKNLPEGETFNFLPKPFSLKQLVETVKQTMSE